jgi:hypothetical protein
VVLEVLPHARRVDPDLERRCSAGPMPESISRFGESMAPADTIVSRRAVTSIVQRVSGVRRATPVALGLPPTPRSASSKVRCSPR